jgi:FKBP-type peptidyl-prolyl cis-trans isomerase FkpA
MRNLSYLLGFLIFGLLLFGCHKHSEYKGYRVHPSGFDYQLIKIGDDSLKCHYSDYVTADITYKTLKDSVFFSGRRKFQISKPDYPGAIDECLTLLGKDDSASFIIPADRFFKKTLSSDLPKFLKNSDKIKINVEIVDVQTIQEYDNEKIAFLKWIEDFGEYEKTILQQYLNESKLRINSLSTGMYYLVLKTGNQKSVNTGDTVVVHYEGRFLNGKFFDSTRQRNDPFQFVYGQQWQVVKGMEEAIGIMHEGEKALFIMPSGLAFGQTGSSTGIIPPFTSLIFEVELVSIKKV